MKSWFQIQYRYGGFQWATSETFPYNYVTADEALEAIRARFGSVTIDWVKDHKYRIVEVSTRVVGGFDDSL